MKFMAWFGWCICMGWVLSILGNIYQDLKDGIVTNLLFRNTKEYIPTVIILVCMIGVTSGLFYIAPFEIVFK